MVFSYYPGCTLKTRAKELDRKAVECAEALGITLEEIPEWQCCGGCYPVCTDEVAQKLSALRTLISARERGGVVITLCSACHNVLKRVNSDAKNNADFRLKASNYMGKDFADYAGETKVVHYIEMLRDTVGFENIKKAVKKPLEGRRIAAYYGCLLLRPSGVMAFDDPENPTVMEELIRSLGAESVVYPYRNECCGGYLAAQDKSLCEKKSSTVLSSAAAHGATEIVTACPLCLYNLNKAGNGEVKTEYFTELLHEALGL